MRPPVLYPERCGSSTSAVMDELRRSHLPGAVPAPRRLDTEPASPGDDALMKSFFDEAEAEAAYFYEPRNTPNFRREQGIPAGPMYEGAPETPSNANYALGTSVPAIENAFVGRHARLPIESTRGDGGDGNSPGNDHYREPDALSENDCDDDDDEDEGHVDRTSLADALQSVQEERLISMAYNHLPQAYIIDESSHPSSQESIEAFLRNHPELSMFYREKWNVDVESAEYLASVMRATKAAVIEEQLYGIGASYTDLKVEETLLRTHPANDMTMILTRNAVELHTEDVAPFKIDDAQDEGIAWGTSNLTLPAQVNAELKNEKWTIQQETAGFMKDVFSTLEADLHESLAEDRKRRVLCKVSSPLLPLSPPLSPERLPTPIAEVELTSTPEDPSAADAAFVDAELAKQDMLDAGDTMAIDSADLKDFLGTTTTETSSPLQRKAKRLQDLKVSDPLLPETSSEPPSKKAKTVSFTNELHTVIPRLPSEGPAGEPSTDEAMATMNALLAPLARPGIDNLEQEQLVEVDTTLRVDVPPVESISLAAPWHLYAGRQRDLMIDVFNMIIKMNGKWSGVSTLEKTLPWSPFPSYLAKVKPGGGFDDGSCRRYLEEVKFEGKVDFANLTWKSDGLLVLEEDDDDQEEELEACDFPGDDVELSDALQSSVQVARSPENQNQNAMCAGQGAPRTHLELDEAVKGSVSQLSSFFSQLGRRRQRAGDGAPYSPQDVQNVLPSVEELTRRRAAQMETSKQKHDYLVAIAQKARIAIKDANSLSQQPKRLIQQRQDLNQFLALQDRQAIDKSTSIRGNDENANSTEVIERYPQSSAPPPPPPEPPSPRTNPLEQPQRANPAPAINPKQISTTIITSPSFDRRLAARLISHCPKIQEIFRQPISSNSTTETEAHLTLSPQTGLHITNLQQLIQKPLPGHEHEYQPFLSKIQTISHRYSTLILLINGPPIHNVTALNTLTSQTSTTSNCEIRTIFIPSEDVKDLVKWIAACIAKYSPSSSSSSSSFTAHIKILEEETYWERFLRIAGFNAFAAQAILDALKPGDLTSFVLMSEEERVHRFAALLGGETVLRRASKVIDARWASIANAP
ncbi:hypothetical protein AC579_3096 [Pseudocercospora musae]|uniref:Uncharacterized protein n=1 Tax=Pseudocercospora musae TaxID=113226 RepID=A0A139IB34_9PEZI|nr:hypothetical protein AC579_309 [Pseudocercospora musae]KXT11978.1 hypothetical protein AC579_3096 [Pseudocercospora musae]